MQKTLLSIGLLLVGGLGRPLAAQSIDPAFSPSTIYTTATTYSALEQADGKRVVVGNFVRAEGTAARTLVRYNANGTLDAAFQQNLGTPSPVYRTALTASGQLLLAGFAGQQVTAGGLSRNSLLRLNANGTGDATFDPGTGPFSTLGTGSGINYTLPLPNGQVLVAGRFNYFNGLAINNLVRLNADGSVDSSFNAGLQPDDEVETVLALANGQFLIGSYNNIGSGSRFNGLARLNANGSFDATFSPALMDYHEANYLLEQPDGKLLVAGSFDQPGTGSVFLKGLLRLLPNGSIDNTFNATAFDNAQVFSYYGPSVQLQPDGKLLVLSRSRASGSNGVVRLNTDGSVDASFQVDPISYNSPFSLQRLASGQVLLSGNFARVGTVRDRSLVQLSATGAYDPAFAPNLQTGGTINAVAQQGDGKLLVGGSFTEINGQPVRRLARFNTNGTLDASFATANNLDGGVSDLVLQPDGRFVFVGGEVVARYLTSGAADNSFVPPSLTASNLTRVLLQPDGKVLVGGSGLFVNGSTQPGLVRLLADGTRDNSFSPSLTNTQFSFFQNMALQPDGKVLVAGNYRASSGTPAIRTLVRLQANGALDGSFTGESFTTLTLNSGLNALEVQPDGKILVGGGFNSYGGVARANVARLNANGTLDAGFVPAALSGTVNRLLVQPNGRILVGGLFSAAAGPANLLRLLPTGAADASYAGTAVPSSSVRALLAQPDGNLVVAGSFSSVGSQPYNALVRLTATNVLAVAAPAAVAARTEAWPVPAHTILTVAPDASAHAQAVELLDLLGRPVLRQALAGATPAVLAVEHLRAGTYLLRVTYAEGLVTRRVQAQ